MRPDATPGGFEPPISTVTGWHVRPLHHGANLIKSISGTIECQEMAKLYSASYQIVDIP